MEIKHRIKMSLDRCGVMPVIDAVQGDKNARMVEITLDCRNQPWEIPVDVSALFRFRKSDGTGGVYDTMEDGSGAFTVSENVITVKLAEQVLTVPGRVTAQVELTKEDQAISTFTFAIMVQADPSVGAMESKDYINLSRYVSEEVERVISSEGLAKAFIVTVKIGDKSGPQTADKTFEETLEAYNAGHDIVCAVYSGVYLVGVSHMVFKSPAAKWFECTVTGQVGNNPVRFVSASIDFRGNDPTLLPQCHATITDIVAEAEGGAGIHIGPEAPTDGSTVWIDTDEEAEAPSGGVSSWNDLTDKPFGVEGNAHFDGDLTGREVLPFAKAATLVKISDKVLTEEECVGAELRYMILHDSSTHSMTITENLIVDATANFGISCFIMGEPLYLQNGVPMVGVIRERGTVQGLEVSAGTYYLTINGSIDEAENMYVSYFSALETVKKLDEKFLPESVDGIVIRSSTADSTKKFKLTVDDNGTISATEIT